MPALVNFGGEDDICLRKPLDCAPYYCSPRKRSRLSAPLYSRFAVPKQQQQQQQSVDSLPDECLFEILRRLAGARERSVSACVSKRWLALVASVRPSEVPPRRIPDLNSAAAAEEDDAGCLTRNLAGEEATDLRLSAIAVGAAGRGGLGRLMILGSPAAPRGVTDLGLSAVARGCPSLQALSMRKLPSDFFTKRIVLPPLVDMDPEEGFVLWEWRWWIRLPETCFTCQL